MECAASIGLAPPPRVNAHCVRRCPAPNIHPGDRRAGRSTQAPAQRVRTTTGSNHGQEVDDVKHKQADVASELKTFADTPARKAAATKLASLKKWPLDAGTAAVMKKLYDEAAKAAAPEAQAIDVALKSYTRPKFAHNAGNAGTLPVWTFQFVDTATKKTGEVAITMTKSMTKDEPTAKKQMSDAAVAEVKKRYPKATVKVNNSSLEK